ncbi:MAG: radical SAM protein [Ignisphaera sp.]
MYDINLVQPYALLAPEDYRIPLGISYLSAVLKQEGFEVKVQDLSFQRIDWNCKVLGISFNLYTYGEAIKLMLEAKKRNIITIAGGPFTKIDPVHCLEAGFDYVFVGEGEVTLPKVLKDIINKKYKEKIIIGEPANLDNLPFPDFSWITGECKYVWEVPFNTSRGCPYQCTFCSKVHGNKWRFMSPKKMVETYLYLLQFRRAISVNDDAFTISLKRLQEFGELLRKETRDLMPLVLHSGMRVDHMSEEMMKILLSLGLTNIGLGVEHIDETILKAIRKGINYQQIETAIKILEKYGFMRRNTAIFLIMGLPGSTLKKDLLAKKYFDRYDVVQSWCIATPIPGTEMYDWVDKNARWLVNPKDYNAYAGFYSKGTVMFETPEYTSKERKLMWRIVKGVRI